jgi:hypothetical protein
MRRERGIEKKRSTQFERERKKERKRYICRVIINRQ